MVSTALQITQHKIDGVTLSVTISGNGPPLFLLHGAFQTWACWRPLIPALAEQFTVIAPDLRGLGRSARTAAGYDMATVAGDIVGLADHLGHERFLIAGHDLGGGVGAALALAAPDRVLGFAFLDMLIPGFGFEDAWVPRPNGQFLWFGALNSVPAAVETLLAGREREYIEFVLKSVSANPEAFAVEDVDDYAQGYAGERGLEPLGQYFRAMWTNAEHFRAAVASGQRITAPVLALGGEHSTGEGAARSIEGIATQVEAGIVPGAGHWLPEEQPDHMMARLLAFFEPLVATPLRTAL